MGENGRKVLYMVVGILCCLVVISAGILYMVKAQPTMKKANEKQDMVNAQLDMVENNAFDNTSVSGSEVISAINTKVSENISILVKTNKNTTGTKYSKAAGANDSNAAYNIKDINDANYIEPTGIFKATLNKTDNGTLTGITFTQTK